MVVFRSKSRKKWTARSSVKTKQLRNHRFSRRRLRKPSSISTTPTAEELTEHTAAGPSPEEEVVRREREQELLEALGRLLPEERLLFYRKYYYLQTTARIAAELGMTERAVEWKLYRLKRRLRKMLGGDQNG